jgi:hypothetical protein
MVDLQILDESGDGILDPGEVVTLQPTIRNVLAAADDVTLQILAVDPLDLEVIDGSEDLGAFARGESREVTNTPLQVRIPADAADDSRVTLLIDVSADGSVNREPVLLTVFPTWRTTEFNRVASTFNSVGNVGYNGTDRSEGDGFYYGTDGSLLWHAGLMIGTSASNLADVIRVGSLSEGTGDGFEMTEPYRLHHVTEPEAEQGRARFRDKNGKVDVAVNMNTWEYAADSDYVLVTYDVENTGDVALTDLHLGLYLDWDLQSNGKGDQASYDAGHNLGFVRNMNRTDLLVGAALLSDQDPAYYAVENLEEGVTSNFTPELKWSFLSGGVQKENTPVDRDVSMVIGGGPVTLDPGARDTFAFGLFGARDFPSMQESVNRARLRYSDLSSVPGAAASGDAFNATVLYREPHRDPILRVTARNPQTIRATLYSADGRTSRVLFDGLISAGSTDIPASAESMASGIWYVVLESDNQSTPLKLLITK